MSEEQASKVAEIKDLVQNLKFNGYISGADALDYLLSELEASDKRWEKTNDELQRVYRNYSERGVKFRTLQEERDSWERVARSVEEEKQSAQQEIERLKQLDGWCCVECEVDFWVKKGEFPKKSMGVSCPGCGGHEHVVCNTKNALEVTE